MKISIVIPIYNSYDLLRRALKSITIPDNIENQVDIVLIDDSPGPLRVRQGKLSAVCNEFPSLKTIVLYNTKNRGVTFSRNRGFRFVTSDYYIFLDSDDTLCRDGLSVILKVLSRSDENTGVFLFRTNKNVNLTSAHGGVELLLSDYGKGERLVVVKNGRSVPFFGALRGHELIGLLRFCTFNAFKVCIDPNVVRIYNDDNPVSISRGSELSKRLPLLVSGHRRVCGFCIKHRYFTYFWFFAVRTIYVWLKIKVAF